MFVWLNKQGVRSDQGFEFQFIDRFSAEYRENEDYIILNLEDGIKDGRSCITISSSDLKMWNSGLLIEQNDRNRIVTNIQESLEFQNLTMELCE